VSRPKVVILGMLTKIPVGGVTWLVGQYTVGFQLLGCDVYYVEAHGRAPSMFMRSEEDDGLAEACAFLEVQLARFGLDGKWAYHDLRTGACFGMSRAELRRLYREAALVINLHGGTVPSEEQADRGRLVYMGTDPVDVEIEVAKGVEHAIEFLEPHVAFFTWGLNHGQPDCLLPWSERFDFKPSPPPVVVEYWDDDRPPGEHLTTIGNWRQGYRTIEFGGETYTWSKHDQFLRVLDLPQRVDQTFELALSSYEPADAALLERNGWRVRPALPRSADPDWYRAYIRESRGEFSMAKDQNVRFRTGWFSERSAAYLAAARPVILQDTGFSSYLPTGSGLLTFSDLDGAVAAVEELASDYEGHREAARRIAREHLAFDVVLPPILDAVGVTATGRPARRRPALPARPACESARVTITHDDDEAAGQVTVDLLGMSAKDHILCTIRRTGAFYEEDLLEHLLREGPRGGLCVDVGANIGNHSVFFGRFLRGRVIAVEPSSAVVPVLARNLRVNRVDAEVVAVALGEHAGTGALVLDAGNEDNVGASRVVLDGAGAHATEGHPIVVSTLDQLLDERANGERLCLVKVDVEGMEELVLRGGLRAIGRDRPDLVIEAATEQRHQAVAEILEPLGYREAGRFCATPTYHYRSERP
jgi:FkbM family methyltransferase